MTKRWQTTAIDQDLVDRLSVETELPPLVTQLLARRNMIDAAELAHFIDPKLTDLRPPEELPGVPQASRLILDAIRSKKTIVIYGDYDADGMNASAILFGCLKRLGATVSYFVPSRLEDGYGLSPETIQRLADRGKEVIISVDCGITSCDEAELCKKLGLTLIVTDHHQFGDTLPDAAAIVHPALPGYDYPFHGLCGAGVAFKLAWATASLAESEQQPNSTEITSADGDDSPPSKAPRVNPTMREFLLQALTLAAIATVADVVPLIDENRIIVRHGLNIMHARPSIGLRALLKICKLDSKTYYTAEDIGFTIAPRLNAAGRLGQAQLGVELLSAEDPERAESLAIYINKLNDDRMKLERGIQLAANKQAKEQVAEDAPAIVVAAANWHVGVIGVVAGRLSEKYHLPSIVIALDSLGVKPGTGSARSPGYVNLHEILSDCRDLLVSCGGHAAAAGLRVTEANLPAFREAFCEAVASSIGSGAPEEVIQIEVECALGQLDVATIRHLEKLAPFGAGNRRPIFFASGIEFASPPKTMGSNDRHFSGQFYQHGATLRAVAFGKSEWAEEMIAQKGPFDLAFRPQINQFRGFEKVELQLVDWRLSGAPVDAPHFERVTVGKTS